MRIGYRNWTLSTFVVIVFINNCFFYLHKFNSLFSILAKKILGYQTLRNRYLNFNKIFCLSSYSELSVPKLKTSSNYLHKACNYIGSKSLYYTNYSKYVLYEYIFLVKWFYLLFYYEKNNI